MLQSLWQCTQMVCSVFTCLLTQVVTLRWEEAGEEMPHILHDIQPDGSGRLDWAAVEESFCADVVNIVGASTPSVFRNGASQGLTRLLFKPGGTIRVIVMRKAPGAVLHSAAAYSYLEPILGGGTECPSARGDIKTMA